MVILTQQKYIPALPKKANQSQKLMEGFAQFAQQAAARKQEERSMKLQEAAADRQRTFQNLEAQEGAYRASQQRNEGMKNASKLLGIDLEALPPEMQQEAIKQFTRQQAKNRGIEEAGLLKYLGGQKPSFADQVTGEKPSSFASSPEQEMDMGVVGVPALIPDEAIFNAERIGEHGLAQQMRSKNQQVLDEIRHQEQKEFKEREINLREKKESPEGKRAQALAGEQAKADISYNKELQASSKQHQAKMEALDRLEKLNEKGVTGKPYEKLLEKSGLVSLTSEGRREFAADVKNLITDIRSILGSQFSQFEFQTILNAYPSADFSKEANRAIIKNLKEFQNLRDQEHKIANQIKKENKGKIPEDFQSMVNERLHEHTQDRLPDIKANTRKIMHEEYGIPQGHMLMFDPQGQPMSVPDEEIDHLIESGATLP